MQFIRAFGFGGEQPRLYAERVNTGGYHWRLLGTSGLLAEDFAEDLDHMISQACEVAEEFA